MSKHVKHVLGTMTEVLLNKSYSNTVRLVLLSPVVHMRKLRLTEVTESGCSDSFPNTGNPVAKQGCNQVFRIQVFRILGQQRMRPNHTNQEVCSEAMKVAAGFIFVFISF